MSNALRYPVIRTIYGNGAASHIQIAVQWASGDDELRACGESWCDGSCGLPALVIPAHDDLNEMKAHSAVVAHGAVMQPHRVRWSGAKVEVPQEHWDDLKRRVWI